MAGGEYLGFNNSIFLSERDTADRNSALGYFMRENMCYPPGEINIANTLDFYFQTCSLEMTCESESVMAATLAKGGVCPITDQRILSPESVKNVLSLMLSCGLYNYSGDFAFKVGLPGKSGVSGALVLVIPNVMGITFWSPPLDDMGNTVRGVQFSEEFVKLYNFHKVTGELSDGSSTLIDPTKNKYEVASQLIIHLLMAASAGDETALKCAYQQGVDMNLGDYDGRTALHLAAAEGHLRCVRFLLEECKVKHDCKDRWGQTPLTEAILFKHTKVASIIKRHERTLNIQNGKIGGKGDDGSTLWRKLVERNLMKPEKDNPVYKFDKNLVQAMSRDEEQWSKDEEALRELKTSLKDQLNVVAAVRASGGGPIGGGGTTGAGGAGPNVPIGGSAFDSDLDTLPEEQRRLRKASKDEEEAAAKVIQKNFRDRKVRKESQGARNGNTTTDSAGADHEKSSKAGSSAPGGLVAPLVGNNNKQPPCVSSSASDSGVSISPKSTTPDIFAGGNK